MARPENLESVDCSAKCIVNSFHINEVSQHLAQLCNTGIDAEDRASKANQEEIICWSLYGRDSVCQKMSDSLNRFKQETQKIIIQWFKSLKENNNKNDLEEEEDDDSILLIIEWNDASLTNRNIQKTP
ncbi:hypothetical protein C2G38_2141744 [Gigaspora rosea]|uniref:Uncharacterized protein n=1 Tax=Gigaspora rosea TaxID=44941 RepID=A0A397VAY3_9GLOM|nr:hypothetical protein C2G38_2141744 [Gigaspora rosea]